MADLSIKNVPPELHRRLKQSAKRSHRSLNREAVYRMELGLQSLPRTPAEISEILNEARKLRRSMKGVWLTAEQIVAAKSKGRP